MPVRPKRSTLHATVLALVAIVGVVTLVGVSPAGTGWDSGEKGAVALLVKTHGPLTPEVVDAISGRAVRVSHVWPEIRAMAVTVAPSRIPELQADPLVELVEYDQQGGTIEMGPDPEGGASPPTVVVPYFSSTTPIQTWNQDMADTPGSGRTGAGVTVAVIDAGLPQNWEEFLPANSVVLEHAVGFGAEGWGDFHNQPNAIRGAGGHIGLFPHGLACASVIVGFPSEFGPIGGAAPDAKILPIRVLNQFNTTWSSWCTAAFVYVGNLKASGAVPGPLVISYSIQFHGDSQIQKDAIDYAISQGVLFVTVAGNFNPFANVSFPGRLPQSITAAACGWRDEWAAPSPWFFADVPEADASQVYMADFSGREAPWVAPASQIDVTAPGSWVFGEWLFGPGFSEGRAMGFQYLDNFLFGTSFACPHVSGIVAQMLEKNPDLTQSQAEGILRGTALPIPPGSAYNAFYPWDERATGTGLVQGTAAVAATPPPALIAAKFGGRGNDESGDARFAVRLASGTGRLPVEFAVRGLGDGRYTASVYDLQGRLVRRWSASATRGTNGSWDGLRGDGTAARSGVYFLRVEADGRAASAKVVLAR